MTKRDKFGLWLFGFVFLCTLLLIGFKPNRPTQVPLRMIAGRPVIEVLINGQGPFKLIFDTGAEINMGALRPDLIEQLNLKPADSMTVRGISGKELADQTLYGPATLVLGNSPKLNVNNLRFLAFDIFDTDPSLASNDIVGLIGIGLLKSFVVSLDFPQQQLLIGKTPHEVGLAEDEKIETIVLNVENNSIRLGIQSTINETKMNTLFDTASSDGLLLSLDLQNQIPTSGPQRVVHTGGIASNSHGINTILDGDLTLKNYTIKNPTLGFIPTTSPNANIGMEILKDFRLGYDHANKQIYLSRKNNTTPTPSP